MTLQFENLDQDIKDMVEEIRHRRDRQLDELSVALSILNENATNWEVVKEAIDTAGEKVDPHIFRTAEPLLELHPLNIGIDPGPCPQVATIIACDGSQIMPDRHAPFLYYLINLGAIAYYHGSGYQPEIISHTILEFPREDGSSAFGSFPYDSASVSLIRDVEEISHLARVVDQQPGSSAPALAILDQRLLYIPSRGLPEKDVQVALNKWHLQMKSIRESGAWLAGFIDRPGKSIVLAMLQTIKNMIDPSSIPPVTEKPAFPHLADLDLFDLILEPGQRSPTFKEISAHNDTYIEHDPGNEVCFFFIKTAEQQGRLARIDIPISVANDQAAVEAIHALILDQCQIVGGYPYVITRADEIAVVTRREQEELEGRIARRLSDLGIESFTTAKQQSKYFARSNKTRHEGAY